MIVPFTFAEALRTLESLWLRIEMSSGMLNASAELVSSSWPCAAAANRPARITPEPIRLKVFVNAVTRKFLSPWRPSRRSTAGRLATSGLTLAEWRPDSAFGEACQRAGARYLRKPSPLSEN